MLSEARIAKALLFGLGCLAVLYGITSLLWPLGWDQGIMAWVGSVVASGGLPFRDAWDPKGPATYLPFALAATIDGQFPITYRAVELLLLLGGAVATGSVVRALGFPKAAPFAGIALVLTQTSLGFRNTLQPDQWAGWLVAGIAALTLRPAHSRWPGVLAGGLVGLAALIKPQYGLFILLPLAGAWRGEGPRWAQVCSILGGAAAPVLLCVGWLAAGNGLDALVDGYLVANLEARLDREGQILSFGASLPVAARAMPYVLPLAIASLFGLAACWRQSRRNTAFLIAWVGLTLVGLGLQGRWFAYVWTPGIPLLVGLGVIGLADLGGRSTTREPTARRRMRLGLAIGLGLCAVGLASRSLVRESRAAASLALGRIDRMEYLSRYWGGGPNFFAAEAARAAEYVAQATSPDESVLVWPEPGVNVLSGRRTPARFATVAALTRYERTPRRERYQAEFLAALERQPPSLILIDSMATAKHPDYLGDLVTRFPKLLRVIHEGYDSAGTIGKYAIWIPHHVASRRYP